MFKVGGMVQAYELEQVIEEGEVAGDSGLASV